MKKIIIILNVIIFAFLIGDYVFISFNSSDGQANLNREPIQIESKMNNFKHNNFVLDPIYKYKIKAVVLSKKEYSRDIKASLSKYDIVLGWKNMSEIVNMERITIEQSERRFFWRVREFFIPKEEIERSISNNHIIASDKIVELKIASLNKGDTVELSGYLVNAVNVDDSSWSWKTSTLRDDTGEKASELFYVDSISVTNK